MNTSVSTHEASSVHIEDAVIHYTHDPVHTFTRRKIVISGDTTTTIDIYAADGSELDLEIRAAVARKTEQAAEQVAA